MSQIQTLQGPPALNGVAGSISTTGTWTSNLTGNCILVYVDAINASDPQTITLTDSAGNNYNEIQGATGDVFGKTGHLGIWLAPITAGIGTKPTITLSLSSAGAFAEVAFTAEERSETFTGVDVGTAGAASYDSTHDSGTTGVSVGGEYVVSAVISYKFSNINISIGSSSPTLTIDTNLSRTNYIGVASGSSGGSTLDCSWTFDANDGGLAIVAALAGGGGGGGPTISAVSFSSVTSSTATITWTTNVASSSQVNYGTTTAYGTSSAFNASLVTSHSVNLSGLTPSTTYHFRADSSNGTLTQSGDFTFTTTAGAPVISAVASSAITTSGATITWTTNVVASSQVDYGLTTGYGTSSTLDASSVTSHSVVLSGLTPNTTYHFRADSSNGTLTQSGDFTFTTLAGPVISAVASSAITTSGATITWTTNVVASSQVDYGLTFGYGTSSTLDASLVISHSVTLSGLTPSTTYHFRVDSSNGAVTQSGDFTFTTSAGPGPVISAVSSSAITSSTATVTWTTNVGANSQVDYGTITAYGTSSALNASLVTSHSVALSGLTPSTVYHFRVDSSNGTLVQSGDFTFTTSAGVGIPVISGVTVSAISNTSATIRWTTNVTATGWVSYGYVSGGLTAPFPVTPNPASTSQTVILSGLFPGTPYFFEANAQGSTLVQSVESTFTTTGVGPSPPVISGVAVSAISDVSAMVTWNTDVLADTQVDYGLTASYGSSSLLVSAPVTFHRVVLTGLTGSSLYHYRANSTAPAPPFASSVSGRRILDQYGVPWLMAGDSAWGMAVDISLSDMAFYFQTRKNQGFTTVLTELVTDTYSGISTTNASTFDGINAFLGTVGGFPDLTTPNPTYWARMDAMVQLAADYGMTLFLVPADCGNQFGDTFMMQAARANGHNACVSFGAFLGNRYRTSPNIVWFNGHDYRAGADDTYVGGISDGIRTAAPLLLQTLEQTVGGSPAYSLQAAGWGSRTNIDLCYVTGLNDTQYTILNSAYAAAPITPMFNGNGMYEGDAGWTANRLRHQVYRTFMAGGAGNLYGPTPNVYGFTAGWQAALTTTSTTEFGYCNALFTSLAWPTLVPDTTNLFLTSGFSSGATLATACLDPAGTTGLVYAAVNGPILCDMTKMRGTTIARWFDPTAGTFTSIGSFPNTGIRTFNNPTAHTDGTSDYLLVLTA